MGGLKPPVSVSGWSLRPGWQSQYNKPHEGRRNIAAACQQGWFHYRTGGQSLRLAHPSSTVRCRISAYCGTTWVDTQETVEKRTWDDEKMFYSSFIKSVFSLGFVGFAVLRLKNKNKLAKMVSRLWQNFYDPVHQNDERKRLMQLPPSGSLFW